MATERNESRIDQDVAAVVLAAGKSTRMRSRLPKPLHPLCGHPLLFHLLDTLEAAGIARRLVVIGHEAETVRQAVAARYGDSIEFVLQGEPRGTGHAVRTTQSALAGHRGPVLVLPGDTPLLTPQVLVSLQEAHTGGATLLSAILDDPAAYGRILRDDAGAVQGIVERKDATPEQAALREINAGVYVFDAPALFSALRDITPNNAQGEYYLTDVIGRLHAAGAPVTALVSPDPDVVLGVNTRIELAQVETRMRQRILNELMLSGVTLVDPATTYVHAGVAVGQDTVLLPGTHLYGRVAIGKECTIGPDVVIQDSTIGDRCRIGPFTRLRPGCVLGDGVRLGNFVEAKNARLAAGVTAGHLTYLGDTTVGENTNIGAGTITCNYDGWEKHLTQIGANVFLGSHTTLIAPVVVEDNAATAAGSVIHQRVPAGDLAIGRARQENKAGWWAARRARRSGRPRPHPSSGEAE